MQFLVLAVINPCYFGCIRWQVAEVMGTGMGTQHMVCTLGDLTHLCEFLLALFLGNDRPKGSSLALSFSLGAHRTQVLFFLAASYLCLLHSS